MLKNSAGDAEKQRAGRREGKPVPSDSPAKIFEIFHNSLWFKAIWNSKDFGDDFCEAGTQIAKQFHVVK